jgi:hypothetical protein
MNSSDFHAGYNKLVNFYGLPDPDDEARCRSIIGEWADMTSTWLTRPFLAAVNQLIHTRPYKSFPQPGELTTIYTALVRSEHRSTDEPRQHRYRAKIDLEIEQIEDAIRALPPTERTALLTRVSEVMRTKLTAIEPIVDNPSTHRGTLQPVIYSIFTGTNSPFIQYETRMQAVQLYAQDHNLVLSQPIPSIFDTPLPHRLTDEEINSRAMDTEEIDTALATNYEEMLNLWQTRKTLTEKRRRITEGDQPKRKRGF